MQLSTSTFPLDPGLAAAPAANAPIAPGLGAATDGGTPAFSTLLSSERAAAAQAAGAASASSVFPTTAVATPELAGDAETAPTAEAEQDAIAAWLAANGFPPPAAPIVIVAPELLSAAADASAATDPLLTSQAATATTPVADEAAAGPIAFPGDQATRRASGTQEAKGDSPAHRTAVVSARALRVAASAAPATGAQRDASAAASSEVSAGDVARSPHTGDAAIAAYQANAVAGNAAAIEDAAGKTRARAAAATTGDDSFPRAGVERTSPAAVGDARSLIAQPAPARTQPGTLAVETVQAAGPEAMADVVTDTRVPPAAPRGNRGRSDSRALATQSFTAAPASTVEGPTVTRGSGGAEKFAVAVDKFADDATDESSGGEKNSLFTLGKEVTGRSAGVGINVAKSETLMSASATTAAPSSATAELERVLPMPAAFETLFTETEQTTTTLVQAARRSVESALNVAEQFATGDKRAVTLQFSVSGVDLGVRVELRGDGVHTTFRTDSPELRAALAQEWQSVAGGQGSDRAARFVDPVFTAASAGNSQQGDASTGQRDSQPRQDRQMADDLAALQVAPRIKTPAPLSSAPVALARGAFVSTSSRLHTFA